MALGSVSEVARFRWPGPTWSGRFERFVVVVVVVVVAVVVVVVVAGSHS
ncbi:MAG: hypothetical protein MJD61_12205 [Proteobacteria bacterium]|nr:hypothetical protein [Pseudomonadota bacterium]